MLATVRAEVLELRRDISGVLVKLYELLEGTPEQAKRLLNPKHTADALDLATAGRFAQVEVMRAEMLELRRDVAIVMANILVASGQARQQTKEDLVKQAKEIVFEAMSPKKKGGGK